MTDRTKRERALKQLENAAKNLTRAAHGNPNDPDWHLSRFVFRLQQSARWGHVSRGMLHEMLDEYLDTMEGTVK